MKKHKRKLQKSISRRQCLSMMGWAGMFYAISDPLKVLTGSIVDGLISKAQAQMAGLPPRNFVCVLFPGGPTRWVWDSILRPKGDASPFVANRSVNTKLTEDTYTGNAANCVYAVEPVTLSTGEVIYMPPIWNQNIPVVGGGWVPMRSMLDNSMIIRGVNMQVDAGHDVGPARVPRPNPNGPSLSGMVADASSTPIPAVATSYASWSHNYGDPKLGGYKSSNGTGITLVRGTADGLNKILSPFQNTDSAVLAHLSKLNSASVNNAMKAAIDELAAFAKSGKPGSDALFKARSKAEELFKRVFGDLKAEYNALSAKYAELESRCAKDPMARILPATGSGSYNINNGGGTGLSGQFAVAEFLIRNGLSSTITIAGSNSAGVAGLSNSNDEHREQDRQKSLICHSFQFRATAAMINELKRALGPSLWEQTVVEVSAEYDRSPRNDIDGSDHAPGSNIMTIMSGAITKPVFIGNILVNSGTGDYLGTWGQGAPVQTDFGSGVRITNEHVASTVATLLNVESPMRAPSLIEIGSGGVQSLAEEMKNV